MIACTAPFLCGTGLGNRLIDGTRARLYCRDHGVPMVAAGPGSEAEGQAVAGTVCQPAGAMDQGKAGSAADLITPSPGWDQS